MRLKNRSACVRHRRPLRAAAERPALEGPSAIIPGFDTLREVMELAKSFEPHAIEAKWYPRWESGGAFKPSWRDGAAPYCIQLPPPNVTGTLHMGHAFQHTLIDILIRLHRMRGDNTLWQVGTDHAGIATQIVVENQLQVNGQSRHALGREAFV